MAVDPNALKSTFESIASALSVLKQAKELLPFGSRKRAAEKAIEQAEGQVKVAQAQAAKELGYVLCKCAFPPNIMTSKDGGTHWTCPACGRQHESAGFGITVC